MLRSCKTLLLWLLLVALPLQGIAAAAMVSCRQVEQVQALAQADHSAHHAYHYAAGDMPMADGQAMHHDGDHHGSHDHANDKHGTSTLCSACAICCVGAAPLPAGFNWIATRVGSEPVVISPAPLVTGFIPSSLERPPRLLSA